MNLLLTLVNGKKALDYFLGDKSNFLYLITTGVFGFITGVHVKLMCNELVEKAIVEKK